MNERAWGSPVLPAADPDPIKAVHLIALAAILARADGRIEITDQELVEVNLSASLHMWRDPSRRVSIIELRSDAHTFRECEDGSP